VPTLMEHNTLITPAYFAFVPIRVTSSIATSSARGILTSRILKVIGVRSVITDMPMSGANLRAQIPIPVSARSSPAAQLCRS
jgi:hypothetical protein